MQFTTIVISAFAALAAASPVESEKRTSSSSQLATFDDLASVPAIPEVAPVGTYKGLTYTSFNVLQQGAAGVITAGVKPQSGKNVASNGITDSVATGGPQFAIAKGYKSFDLSSLYVACVVNSVESAAGVPEQCTLAFTAYKAGSNTPYQTVNKQFNPTNAVLSKMSRADFPSGFSKLGKVEVAVVQSTTSSSLSGLLIDNVAYKLNK